MQSDEEFEAWARAWMKQKREAAAAITELLGLPQDQRFKILRVLHEAAHTIDETVPEGQA